jgi:TPR repeat protein
MHLFKLLLALFMSAAGAAFAGPYEEAKTAYDNGDYATALRLIRPFAEQGRADAQYNLGLMYANGQACRRTTCRRTFGGISRLPRAMRTPSRTATRSPRR